MARAGKAVRDSRVVAKLRRRCSRGECIQWQGTAWRRCSQGGCSRWRGTAWRRCSQGGCIQWQGTAEQRYSRGGCSRWQGRRERERDTSRRALLEPSQEQRSPARLSLKAKGEQKNKGSPPFAHLENKEQLLVPLSNAWNSLPCAAQSQGTLAVDAGRVEDPKRKLGAGSRFPSTSFFPFLQQRNTHRITSMREALVLCPIEAIEACQAR